MRITRRICQVLLPLTLSLLLAGCDIDNPLVLSAQPLYTGDTEVSFDPALVGSWVDAEGDVRFTFEKEGQTTYNLVITEIDTSSGTETAGAFDAHPVRLGPFTFLDFYPQSPKEASDFYMYHLLHAHSFARIWWEGNELHMALFDGLWLKERIEEKSVDTDSREVDDRILLTAPTREVQDLVYRFATDEHAFPNPFTLRLVRGIK